MLASFRIELIPRHRTGRDLISGLSPFGRLERLLPALLPLALEHAGQLRRTFLTRLDTLAVSGADVVADRIAPSTDALRVEDALRHHRLRLAIDALVFITAVINTRGQPRIVERLVRNLRPALAQPQQIILGWSEPTSMALLARQLESRARADSSGTHLTRGHQNVRVMMSLIGLWTRLMDREVHRRVIPIGEFV